MKIIRLKIEDLREMGYIKAGLELSMVEKESDCIAFYFEDDNEEWEDLGYIDYGIHG